METKLKEVEKQKNHLAKKNKSWETDVQQLKDQMREQEEKFSEDLAEKHLSWESEKHQLEDERREMETTLKQVEESKKKLAEENHSLESDVTLKDLLVKQFEKDMEVQEDKSSKQHQSWETKASSMETEIKEAEDENNLSWETKVQQLEEDMKEQKEKCSKDLSQKHQSWETTVHLMETQLKEAKEERDDLAQTQLSWEAKEKKMEDEKTLLEDLCLHMKNKSRGFFARRRATEERDAILQKML
ncbi:Keratin type I cytoskeletal 9, partial [Dissostichus eleginoides]